VIADRATAEAGALGVFDRGLIDAVGALQHLTGEQLVYGWPVGFHVRLNLADYRHLEEHELGETTFTHFADGLCTRTACGGMISSRA
jgi:hypothetical protein